MHQQPLFSAANFPHNLPAVWQRHWACLTHCKGPAVMLGEWGGRGQPDTPDRAWFEALASFLVDSGLDVGFYWCLNPNSGDTGGLLQDDWTTPESWKLQVLHRVTPDPTRFSVGGAIT